MYKFWFDHLRRSIRNNDFLDFVVDFINHVRHGKDIKVLKKYNEQNNYYVNYENDYKTTKQRYDEKIEKFLKENLKEECYNCKAFNAAAEDSYFCAVENSCPGLVLRPYQKKQILGNKVNNCPEIKLRSSEE
jgi:hypothetical protein